MTHTCYTPHAPGSEEECATFDHESVHDSYALARKAAADVGMTHASEPGGYTQTFYRRGVLIGHDVWYFRTVYIRPDGKWVLGRLLLDWRADGNHGGTLPFVGGCAEVAR